MGLLWFIIRLSSSPIRETDNSPLFAVQMRFAGAIDVRFQRRTAFYDSDCWRCRTSLVFSRMHAIYEHTNFIVVTFVSLLNLLRISGCISELAFISRNGSCGCEEGLFVCCCYWLATG